MMRIVTLRRLLLLLPALLILLPIFSNVGISSSSQVVVIAEEEDVVVSSKGGGAAAEEESLVKDNNDNNHNNDNNNSDNEDNILVEETIIGEKDDEVSAEKESLLVNNNNEDDKKPPVDNNNNNNDENDENNNNNNDDEEDDDVLVQETIAAGRGHRDERGERDQWSSTEHIGAKFDSRRPISPKVKALLEQYRLECDGCDHNQAVMKINIFIQEAKEEGKQQAARDEQTRTWLKQAAIGVTILAVVIGGFVLYNNKDVVAFGTIDATKRRQVVDIAEQRRLAAIAAEERAAAAAAAAKDAAPNWRELEEKEVWTPQQEKQFAKALQSFGGVPPKARYILMEERVTGKTRKECQMHHKLLQLQKKEAKEKEIANNNNKTE